MFEGRASGPHLDDCLREILVMFLQPFEVSVFVLQNSPLTDQISNGTEALLGEVVADQICQAVLAAAIEHDGQLLNNFSHICQRFVELACHEIVVEGFEGE